MIKNLNNRFNKFAVAVAMMIAIAACTKDEETPTPTPQPPQEVNVPDSLLRNAIKAKLGLTASQAINVQNIKQLDTLDIDGGSTLAYGEISNLTGLEAATELLYLHFGATKVTNLTPIANLKKVQYLRMNGTQVTDLSPISEYNSLTYFNANGATSLVNISPLSKNTGLKEMILRDVPMGNTGMTTIANFTSLYRLNMRNTGVTDIQVLADLMAAGALQNSTPGAAAEGGATLDLRQLTVNCTLITQYLPNINSLDGPCQ